MIKFPHTSHLAWLGAGTPRQDKVFSSSERLDFLSHPIVVEEKVDGANVGIAFQPDGTPLMWNRGTLLGVGAHPQFQALWPWLAQRQATLAEALSDKLVLFGEWCFAVHSIHYDCLPDYFLVIDVYDKRKEKFWGAGRRSSLAQNLGLAPAPMIANGRFNLDALCRLLDFSTSCFGSEPIEGLYLRREKNGWLEERAKLVRPEFTQAIEEHWMNRPLERNMVDRSAC